MTRSNFSLTAALLGSALMLTACSVAGPMTPQETQIKADLATDQYMPATRQMRDAIETQELFAQAAFWSNEYDVNPSDLEAAIKLAAAVRKLGNPGRAIEITQTTRALYPKNPYLIAEYAAALIASERALDAMSISNEGHAIAPAYGRLWSLKGAALDQQERYAEARQHYDRALRITPNDQNVMANMGLSHALAGDAATAEGWLRRAAALPNASPSVMQNLMLVLQLQGKTAEAEKIQMLNSRSSGFSQTPSWQNKPQPRTAQVQPRPQTAPQMPNQNFTGAPAARLSTGAAPGQRFSSASEAARAMASKQRSSVSDYESGRPAAPQPQATPEQQQAMLDRSARSLQAQPVQPAHGQAPQARMKTAPQSYPQQFPNFGTPVPPQTNQPLQQPQAPTRRKPQRSR